MNIIQKLKNNKFAFLANTVSSNVFRLASNILLAYLLVPSDFAIAGIVATTLYALNMISDVGFRPFILRTKKNEISNYKISCILVFDYEALFYSFSFVIRIGLY